MRAERWRHCADAYPRRVTVATRYGDMDANAHLNNVAIARLVEEARVRFHWGLADAGADPVGLMVAHVAIDYVREARYPEAVDAGLAAIAVGARSYRLAVGLFQEAGAVALADCVMVCRGASVPERLRAVLDGLGPRL